MNRKQNLYIIIFCIFLALAGSFLVNIDPDTLFHIKIGDVIIENGSIPQTETLSYFGGPNVNAHEWLSEVVLAFTYNKFGFLGVQFITSILAFSVYYIILKYLFAQNIQKAVFAPMLLFLYTITKSNFFNGRPQVFSLPLFILVIVLIFKYIDTKEKKNLIFIPLISLLYANLHGGATSQLILLLVLLTCMNMYEWIKGRLLHDNIPFDKNFIIVTGVSFFLSLLNPSGFGIYSYAFKIMNNKYSEYIQEWGTLPINTDFSSLVVFGLLFTPVILCLLNGKKIDIYRTGISFFYIFMTFSTVRLLFQTNLIILILYYKEITNFIGSLNKKAKIIGYVGMLSIVIVIGTINLNNYLNNQDKVLEKYPTQIVNYIKERNIDLENNILFNDYGDGGYLLFSDMKVFIDGRQDPYLKEFGNTDLFPEYIQSLTLGKGEKEIEKLIEHYNIKYLLVSKDGKEAAYALNNEEKWMLEFIDNNHFLFKKRI